MGAWKAALTAALVSASWPAYVSASEKPNYTTQVSCTVTMDMNRRIVEETYELWEIDGRRFVIKTDEKILKTGASPEDLKHYKPTCDQKKETR